MGGKTAIGLGLVSGVLAGGLTIGALIALTPGPATPSPAVTPAPTESAPTGSDAPSDGPSGDLPGGPTASGGSPVPSATSLAQAFGVGEPAPVLELPGVGGEPVNLADYRGRPVWVNFMATWCPPCRDELPLMAGFQARYDDTGLVVIAVDVGEDEATVQAFFADLGIYIPVALDSAGTAQAAWGAIALPVHFWIDENGTVRDGALGGIGPDVMAAGLQTILPGVTVTP
jgi:cytochrome c biogenesis protein CcmG/thiol:disulfide interchange protein DsbE